MRFLKNIDEKTHNKIMKIYGSYTAYSRVHDRTSRNIKNIIDDTYNWLKESEEKNGDYSQIK